MPEKFSRSRRSIFGVAVTAAVSVSVFWASAVASAGPPGSAAVTCSNDLVLSGSCDLELTELCVATEAAKSPPIKQRDKDGLVGKVVMASVKLSLGKVADAEGKLVDYETKLDALAGAVKPKIDDGDASALAGLVLSAQLCVAAIP